MSKLIKGKRFIAVLVILVLSLTISGNASAANNCPHTYVTVYISYSTVSTASGHTTYETLRAVCDTCHLLLTTQNYVVSTTPHSGFSTSTMVYGGSGGTHTHVTTKTYTCCGYQVVTSKECNSPTCFYVAGAAPVIPELFASIEHTHNTHCDHDADGQVALSEIDADIYAEFSEVIDGNVVVADCPKCAAEEFYYSLLDRIAAGEFAQTIGRPYDSEVIVEDGMVLSEFEMISYKELSNELGSAVYVVSDIEKAKEDFIRSVSSQTW